MGIDPLQPLLWLCIAAKLKPVSWFSSSPHWCIRWCIRFLHLHPQLLGHSPHSVPTMYPHYHISVPPVSLTLTLTNLSALSFLTLLLTFFLPTSLCEWEILNFVLQHPLLSTVRLHTSLLYHLSHSIYVQGLNTVRFKFGAFSGKDSWSLSFCGKAETAAPL